MHKHHIVSADVFYTDVTESKYFDQFVTLYKQGLFSTQISQDKIGIRMWISNDMHQKERDVIYHPCFVLTKVCLTAGEVRVWMRNYLEIRGWNYWMPCHNLS